MPSFQIFSASEIDSLRQGGKVLRECLAFASSLVRAGVTTKEIDQAAEEFILSCGAKPAFKGYRGYPGTLCISVNDEVVHGMPGPRVLSEGDVVSLDGGVLFDDLYTDACVTVGVGELTPAVLQFLDVTSSTLERVVADVVRGGVPVGTISSFIQESLEKSGYRPVRQLTGHGLGSSLHQFPDVPNVGRIGTGPVLPAGALIAIEPIASMGSPDIKTDPDGWTIRTADGSLACHFEHTVLITEGGCEIIA